MRKALDNFQGFVEIRGHRITNLQYANDVVLIAGSMQELQDLINRIVSKSEAVGLYPNVNNTKLMKIKTIQPSQENLIINGDIAETVDNFNYFGATITNTHNDSKEIKKKVSMQKSQ